MYLLFQNAKNDIIAELKTNNAEKNQKLVCDIVWCLGVLFQTPTER